MRLGFIAEEVAVGFRRNLTMTIAVIVTIAASLSLFGAGLLVRAQVSTMKDYWYDKVEVSIYLCSDTSDTPSCTGGAVTPAQRTQIRADLEAMSPLVQKVFYESQQQSYKRFIKQFKNSAIVQNVSADALPESFRVKLSNPEMYDVIASAFTGRDGIEQVQDQRRLLDKFFKLLNGLQTVALAIAVAMLLVTVLLVVNTMRVAAHSRRREIGIMRLVGASNWYVRLPFVAEAAIAAAIGAAVATGVLAGLKHFGIDQRLAPEYQFTSFVGWDAVWGIVPLVFFVGVGISVLAAAATLRRHLRV
jgi:cell division transport system permease protein